MLISKETMERIKRILERKYSSFMLSVAGKKVFSQEELKNLEKLGVDTSKPSELLTLLYFNNLLNDFKGGDKPKNISQMKNQQTTTPDAPTAKAASEHLNENITHMIEKLKGDMQSRIEGIIREGNLKYRADVMQNPSREDHFENLMKQSSVGRIKQELRDLSGEAERNWERVAITETSNALGMGSADRIVNQNPDKAADEVYVYRISILDNVLCKYCRKFYVDNDSTPAVYRLSTILGNGTNYGKKAIDWKPVAGATHPNERCSGIIELRPGWKVVSGGKVEYIGMDDWDKYIRSKVRD